MKVDITKALVEQEKSLIRRIKYDHHERNCCHSNDLGIDSCRRVLRHAYGLAQKETGATFGALWNQKFGNSDRKNGRLRMTIQSSKNIDFIK